MTLAIEAKALAKSFGRTRAVAGVDLAVALVQAFVNLNPISHTAAAVRGLMHGNVQAGQVGRVFLESAALIAVFGPLTMYFYRNKR